MATDRGGLNYNVKVTDAFSANLKKFRGDVAKARAEWAKFRAEMARPVRTRTGAEVAKVRREIERTSRVQRRTTREQEGFSKDQIKRLKEIKAASKAKNADDREAAKLSKQVSAEGARQARAQAAAVRKQAAAQRAQAVAARRTQVEARRQAAAIERAKRAQDRATAATARGARVQKRLTQNVRETGSAVNRVSFTFRRLFGILAAFTAARLGVQGFGNLIRGAINFNRQVEDSRIAIAGLIVATGKVTDAQGRSLEGAEKFAAAQKEAARQTALLRQDALATVATFQEISKAFTAGVGPGLEAGLNLDEVRRTTVLVSQAAGSLGLAQNQLIEEIRSLLRGTIQARTTLVASVLGITNEDIRNAKETGTLFDFLQSRLQGFRLAAAETQNTVTGLAARIRDAFGFVTGLAAVPFFVELKETLRDIFQTLVNIRRNAKGVIEKITPNQKVLTAFSLLFNGMQKFTASLRAGIEDIDFAPLGEGIGKIFAALGEIDFAVVLRQAFALASALGEIIGAAITATSNIVTALAPLASIIKSLSPLLSILIQVKIFMGAIAFVTKEIVVLMSLMPIHLTKAGAAAAAAATQLTLMQRAANIINLALVGVALSASTLINVFGDVNVTLAQGVTLMATGFVNAMNTLILKSRILGLRLQEALGLDKPVIDERGTLKSIEIFFGRYGKAWNAAALEIIGASDLSKELKKQLAEELLTDTAIREAASASSAIQIEVDKLRAKLIESDLLLGKQFQDIVDGNAARKAAAVQHVKDLKKLQEQLAAGFDVTGIRRAEAPTEAEKQAQLAQLGKVFGLKQEVGARAQILELQKAGFAVADIALVKEDAKLDVFRLQLQFSRLLLAAKIAEQEAIVKQTEGTKRHAFESTKLFILEEQRAALLEKSIVEAEELARAFEKVRLIAEGSIFEGFGAGIRGLAEQMGSSFQAGVAIMKNAVQSFASFISQSIVDAFDPTKDTDLLERFGRFLQQLAQMIIQQLIQLAIARAVLGLNIGSSFGGLGFAKGGEVPDKKAKGPKPKGISKSDTVRAWLQPGEFVQKLSAVRKYGTDVMDAINSGLVDPAALRALALKGQMRRMTARAKRNASFAEGGLVGAGVAAARAVTPAKSREKTTPAPIFFGQQQMERFLGGGGGVALMRWFRDNQQEVSIALNANRS